MTYTLIGTGNMAWFLAGRLHQGGHRCQGIWGRSAEAAGELASAVQAPVVERPEALPEADCCILAVSDRVVAELAARLPQSDSVVIHTAGSLSLDALPQPEKAVLWPVYSIRRERMPAHRAIPMVYEAATEEAAAVVKMVAAAASDLVTELDGPQRQWLHLCAVLGNNFTNHLVAICEQICREREIPFGLLRPILEQTFEGFTTEGAMGVQTGPAKRKDGRTQQQHLQLLRQFPVWQELYRSLSASIEDMYRSDREEKDGNR